MIYKPCGDSVHQKFALYKSEDGLIQIRTEQSDLCIGLEHHSQESQNVTVYYCNGVKDQVWRTRKVDLETVQIVSNSTKKCMVRNAKSDKVQHGDCENLPNVNWKLMELASEVAPAKNLNSKTSNGVK